MSIPRRIWRIAQGYARNAGVGVGVGGSEVGGAPRSDAERELDEFLAGHRIDPPPSNGTGDPNGHHARENGSAPPPPNDPLAPHYLTLGVPVGSDLATIESAWRKLVLENHPDRFMHDPEKQRRATARLRQINEAHDALEAALAA